MLLLISSKLYSWSDFSQLGCQKINSDLLNYRGNKFRAGASFPHRNSAMVLKQIQAYLQENIFAFAVEHWTKQTITIWYLDNNQQSQNKSKESSQTKDNFNPKQTGVISNNKNSDNTPSYSIEKVEKEGLNPNQNSLRYKSKNAAKIPTLPPKPKVIAEREDSSRKRLQYRGKRY